MSAWLSTGWIFRPAKRRRRERLLDAAASWPTATARILKSTLVPKDDLAEGSAAQIYQIECSYYFTLDTGFFGGHLRSLPCSDSEGRRLEKQIAEGTPVTVRYNPQAPDQACTLPADNPAALPFSIWPG